MKRRGRKPKPPAPKGPPIPAKLGRRRGGDRHAQKPGAPWYLKGKTP